MAAARHVCGQRSRMPGADDAAMRCRRASLRPHCAQPARKGHQGAQGSSTPGPEVAWVRRWHHVCAAAEREHRTAANVGLQPRAAGKARAGGARGRSRAPPEKGTSTGRRVWLWGQHRNYARLQKCDGLRRLRRRSSQATGTGTMCNAQRKCVPSGGGGGRRLWVRAAGEESATLARSERSG